MIRIVIITMMTLLYAQTHANVNYIHISKISNSNKLIAAFDFIKSNKEYYDHWTNEWNYDKPKADLVIQLREYYSDFSEINIKNEETYLLLGDIAAYLYNMDDTAAYDLAVNNYKAAIKIDPKDYRGYWFLGYHYSLSNEPEAAIDNLLKAETLLPTTQTSDFWNDYAFATNVANMPSHCIYAMDRVKNIDGKEGSFEQQLGQTVYKRIIPVDKDQFYDIKDIWAVDGGKKKIFISRPLGIKIITDSSWGTSIYNYKDHQSAFIINPPTIANAKGTDIHYTIAILMRTANSNDKLEDYINALISKYSDRKRIFFSNKYDKTIAWEIRDNTTYTDIGGGHMYMIGIERNEPAYPGLLLEDPMILPNGEAGKLNFYTVSDSKERFKGRIFYAIMLDSREDINLQSFNVFKLFFDNQIIIE